MASRDRPTKIRVRCVTTPTGESESCNADPPVDCVVASPPSSTGGRLKSRDRIVQRTPARCRPLPSAILFGRALHSATRMIKAACNDAPSIFSALPLCARIEFRKWCSDKPWRRKGLSPRTGSRPGRARAAAAEKNPRSQQEKPRIERLCG